MCGISGLISQKNLSESDLAAAQRMNDTLFRRGPDGEGFYRDEKVALGMRRLSIIDIEGANQPLFGTSPDIVVLFNGEIYNYLELRKELENEGHRFKTDGDGEVIPHLYEKYGTEFVHRLRGMFAISLLDRRKRRLFLFRDRMGEKPIYYFKDGERFFYSSEMKSLLTVVPTSARRLSPEAVNLYLHYQFVPEPRTLVENIHKVPAGYFLELDLDKLDYELHQYWSLSECPPVECISPELEVRKKLDSIMKIIGRSDVPVGIALSGGLDSSAIAALFAHENRGRDLAHAFTVGYPGAPRNDERKNARELAASLGIPIEEIELKAREFIDYFPSLVADMDDPVADIAAYGIFSVMRAARLGGVKVLLNGVGADEIFWGYPWVARGVDEERKSSGRSLYDANRDFVFASDQVRRLHPQRVQAAMKNTELHAVSTVSEKVNPSVKIMDLLVKGWLFADPVALGDRLSMRNSIELRSPFLDHELVELMVGLNKTYPDLYRQPAKKLLKDAVRGLVPEDVLIRPKQGFTPPAARWRLGVLWKYGRRIWCGYLVRNQIISRSGLVRLFLPTWKWKLPYAPLVSYLYKLLVLEIWCENFLDRNEVTKN
jgi:asparagine synthase (glutamine-hydrolysing)